MKGGEGSLDVELDVEPSPYEDMAQDLLDAVSKKDSKAVSLVLERLCEECVAKVEASKDKGEESAEQEY